MLRDAGQGFEVCPSEAPEVQRPGEAPERFAVRAARAKAEDVQRRIPGRWVLAADTIVVVDREVLGKPRDSDDARRMLLRLSGRDHEVLTAFVLLDDAGKVFAREIVRTRVYFRLLSREEIDEYVASEEPRDKAGAYAIQGGAKNFVSSLEGSWSNVVGLPLEEVRECLRSARLWKESGMHREARA